MSTEKLSELSKPVRIHRDWNHASVRHCVKCDRSEMTIADADGVQTCASCYDAEWLSELQDYAEAADKRIAELEAKLATPVQLPDIRSDDYHEAGWFQHINDLEKSSRENWHVVRVRVGVLKSAIRAIEATARVNGKGIFTDMVLNALNSAVQRGE